MLLYYSRRFSRPYLIDKSQLITHYIINLKFGDRERRDLIHTEERCWLKRKYYPTILKKYMSLGFPG